MRIGIISRCGHSRAGRTWDSRFRCVCGDLPIRGSSPSGSDAPGCHLGPDRTNLHLEPGSGSILDAANAAGLSLPSGCRVGQCESCVVRVIKGTVLHLLPYDGPAHACLTCQVVQLSNIEIST
ncbi:2Fe-2S iron-sulfur cluster binding domain-containing protein [Burkholderia pyrrocinia]|uniref:2Fe-2S iron-sulfur cluster-binding protein n=1 Tax=Burkholderia pyrrocinia TaxID=60550 RepID=UPI0009DF9ECC